MDELSSRGSVRPSGIRFRLPGLILSKKEGKGMQDLLRRTNFSQYAIYVGFLLIFVIFSVALYDDGFLTRFNLFNIVQQAAPITIMSVGMVFVLTAGEIDLSIGSIVAVTALIAAVLLRTQAWPIAVAGGLFTGALIGALNGALVSYGRLPSFLITLATMGVFQGVARRLTDLQPVPIQNETFNAIFGSGDVAGIPSLIIWTIVATLIGWFFFQQTRYGAHIHATGDSANAARATGIKVLRLRFSVMVLSGVMAALAGLLYAGRLHGARYNLGEADLLTVIAAVIVGGTKLNGGSGTILGALIGSLLMSMLNNGLILWGYQPSDQLIARGLIILVAVVLTARDPNR
jgi:ribose transport system permease protein